MPYWLYGVASGWPGAAGGFTSESIPELADSGSGPPGAHRLFRAPVIPDCPMEQNPSKPPMSPMPGTEQRPPAGATLAVVVAGMACAAEVVTWWPVRPAA